MASWTHLNGPWSGEERRKVEERPYHPDQDSHLYIEEDTVMFTADEIEKALLDEIERERRHPEHACSDDRWCPEFGCQACGKDPWPESEDDPPGWPDDKEPNGGYVHDEHYRDALITNGCPLGGEEAN